MNDELEGYMPVFGLVPNSRRSPAIKDALLIEIARIVRAMLPPTCECRIDDLIAELNAALVTEAAERVYGQKP